MPWGFLLPSWYVATAATARVCALTQGPLEIYCDAFYVLYNGTSSTLCSRCHCRLLLFLREQTKRGQTPRQNAYSKPWSSYRSEEVQHGNGRIFQLIADGSAVSGLADSQLGRTDFSLSVKDISCLKLNSGNEEEFDVSQIMRYLLTIVTDQISNSKTNETKAKVSSFFIKKSSF